MRRQTPAFTRLELVACLGALALVLTVVVPALANSSSRSDRIVCFSNLRQIAVAYGQFGLEHDDRMPWRVSSSQGGNMDHPLKNYTALQFSAVSNGLATPKVLTDPGDQRIGLRVANNWGSGSGGLLNPSIGNNAISYFLGLDGGFIVPASILAGDHNLPVSFGQNCSSGVVPTAQLATPAAWTNAVHGLAGNIVFFDGSAAQVDSARLRAAFDAGPKDSISTGSIHLQMP